MFDSQSNVSESKGDSKYGLTILLAVLFLPAVIIGFTFWFIMFRKLRQKRSVSAVTMLILELLLVVLWISTEAFSRAMYVFSDLSSFATEWTELLPAVLIINAMLGFIGGFGGILWQVHTLKNNPDRVHLEGSWTYKFKYRRSPIEVLRRKRTIEGLKKGEFLEEGRAPLGLDEENGDLVAYRFNEEAVKQTLISGGVGSGKTITMLSLIYADIQEGKPLIIIDFKRSPQLASKAATWAKDAGAGFYHFVSGDPKSYNISNSPGQAFWDPLASGSRTYKADMVLNMREYDTASAVYKDNMTQLLQVLFAMLEEADKSKAPSIDWQSGGIKLLASAIKDDNLMELAIACEGTSIQEEAEGLAEQAKGKTQIAHAVGALQGQLRTITASDYGRWMKFSKDEEDRNIKLHELTSTGNNVILFSLNSDDEKEFATFVGSMILSNITAVSAMRRNEMTSRKFPQLNVYVDEFQAVPPTSVTSLLEKSRESKIAMTLAQQSFEQIISSAPSNGEAYLLSILDTCSNFIIHAGMTEDSAERLSKILGKEEFTDYVRTNQSSSFFFSWNWSNKRNNIVQTRNAQRWIFEPSRFLRLSSPDENNGFKSTAVIINKVSADSRLKPLRDGAAARQVWMIPSQEVLVEHKAALKPSVPTKTIALNEESDLTIENLEDTEEDFLSYSSRIYNSHLNGEDPDYSIQKTSKQSATEDSSLDSFNDYSQSSHSSSEYVPEYYDEAFEPVPPAPTEEQIDGDFEWEVLDEETENELNEVNSKLRKAESKTDSIIFDEDLEELPSFNPPALDSKAKNVVKNNSFEEFFNPNFIPEKRENKKLGKNSVKKENSLDSFNDDDELPDLDF